MTLILKIMIKGSIQKKCQHLKLGPKIMVTLTLIKARKILMPESSMRDVEGLVFGGCGSLLKG